MLNGTTEEYLYHYKRAQDEMAKADRAGCPTTSDAHRSLASFHLARSELVAGLKAAKARDGARPIFRTDKEG